MNFAACSSAALLLAASGCVVISGPVTYGDGGGGSTGTSSNEGGSDGGTSTSTCGTALSDEFAGASPDACWKQLEPLRFAAPPSTAAGELSMLPASLSENGWFKDHHGPFLYQDVAGDFVFVVRAAAGVASGGGAPDKLYNTAGVLVRDPASTAGHESWALMDIGMQGGGPDDNGVAFGSIIKVTKPAMTSGQPSETVKSADATGSNRATFAICRQGQNLTLHLATGDETEPYSFTPDVGPFTWGNISGTLQVGLVTGTWVIQPDVVARFDYARFAALKPQETCVMAVERVFQNLP